MPQMGGSSMGMGHGGAGMGMGPGTAQFSGNMNVNMMGGGQPTGGYNHIMPGGSGMGHPSQVRNSESRVFVSTVAVTGRKRTLFRLNENRVFRIENCHQA